MQGSELKAGNNLALKAENEVKLLAAQNTSEQHSNNKNISGSVGVSFGTDGLMFNAGLSGGKGHGDGTEVTQTNTHASAGNKLTISSGSDTTLSGAVASGKRVEVNVGNNGQGNLNIASLQDTNNYHSSQQQMGGSISVGAGKMSGSVSASHSKVDATYASVIEQSSINAGDGGFQIKVNGNTDLKGAKITSTDKAIADGKNSLTTQTLTTSDIQNHSSYDAESHSASLSGGYTGSQAALNRPGLGYGSAGGNQSSTTQSGISELAGDKTVRSDKDSSHKLVKDWDGQALQQDVMTQAQVMQTVVPQAAKLIGDVATQQMKEALERGDAEAVEKWKDGGIYRVALHTLLGALSGGAAGATGAAATAVSVPEIATAIKNLGLPEGVANSLIAVAGTAVGAVAGGAQGAAVGFNQVANNYLKHQEIEALASASKSCLADGNSAACSEVSRLEALDKQRDRALDACAGNTSAGCDAIRQDVRQAAADIIRYGNANTNLLNHEAKQHTKDQADSTMSQLDRTKGGLAGIANSVGEASNGLTEGFFKLLQAMTGGEQAQEDISRSFGNVLKLLDPATLSKAIDTASTEQRNKIADAYERGDSYVLGKVAGDVLAMAMPSPVGSVAKVGGGLAEAVRATKMGARTLEELSNAAKILDAADRGGELSLAGRALQKHGGREGSAFPSAKGNPLAVNEQGQRIVDEILSDPLKTYRQEELGRYGRVVDIRASDGRGLRYDSHGKLIGFLEPNK